MVAVSSAIAVVAISAAVEGFIHTNLNVLTRLVLGISSLLLIVPEFMTDIIGYPIIILIFVLNYIKSKKETPAAVS